MKKGMHRVVSAQDTFRDEVSYAKLTKTRRLDARFERLGKAFLLSDYHYDFFALASDPSMALWNVEIELHEVDFSYIDAMETHPWVDLYVGRKEDHPEEHVEVWGKTEEESNLFWQTIGNTMKNVRSENGKYNFYFSVKDYDVRGYVENQSGITRDTILECARAFARGILNVDIPTSRMFFVHPETVYDWHAAANARVQDLSKLEAGLLDVFRRYHPSVLKELGFAGDETSDIEALVLEGVMKLQSYLNGRGCDLKYFSDKIREIAEKQGEDVAIEYCKSIKHKCGFFPLASGGFDGTLARVLSAFEKCDG